MDRPATLSDRRLAGRDVRKLREKTGVESPYLEQLDALGSAKRDPRGWSVTQVYVPLAFTASALLEPTATPAALDA